MMCKQKHVNHNDLKIGDKFRCKKFGQNDYHSLVHPTIGYKIDPTRLQFDISGDVGITIDGIREVVDVRPAEHQKLGKLIWTVVETKPVSDYKAFDGMWPPYTRIFAEANGMTVEFIQCEVDCYIGRIAPEDIEIVETTH